MKLSAILEDQSNYNRLIKDLRERLKQKDWKYTIMVGDDLGGGENESFLELQSKTKDGGNMSKVDQDRMIKFVIDFAADYGYKLKLNEKHSKREQPNPDFFFYLA